MKVLLVGPFPPPHGGISVHVAGVHRELLAAGVDSRVLNMAATRPGLRFCAQMLRHASEGRTLHFHTNGHAMKSWILALSCGLAGRLGNGSVLTLHSGMVPAYLRASRAGRRLASVAGSLYKVIVCVNPEIRESLAALGIDSRKLELLPAFLNTSSSAPAIDPQLSAWMSQRRPLFSTALFFRPEYGFDLLVEALARFRAQHPDFGCVVMGSGEDRAIAENRVHDAGLDSNVRLIGDVDHDTCLALISASDTFVRATLEDGDSISVREALALGVPVVASRVGARPAEAILFERGNVGDLVAKLSSPQARIRSLPQQDCAPRLLEIYRSLDRSQGALCLN